MIADLFSLMMILSSSMLLYKISKMISLSSFIITIHYTLFYQDSYCCYLTSVISFTLIARFLTSTSHIFLIFFCSIFLIRGLLIIISLFHRDIFIIHYYLINSLFYLFILILSLQCYLIVCG